MMITIVKPNLLGRNYGKNVTLLGWNLQLAFVEEPELTLSSQTGVRELSPKAQLGEIKPAKKTSGNGFSKVLPFERRGAVQRTVDKVKHKTL
jgi:hypothetical protein